MTHCTLKFYKIQTYTLTLTCKRTPTHCHYTLAYLNTHMLTTYTLYHTAHNTQDTHTHTTLHRAQDTKHHTHEALHMLQILRITHWTTHSTQTRAHTQTHTHTDTRTHRHTPPPPPCTHCTMHNTHNTLGITHYYSSKNVYLPVFCFEGLITEFPKFTYRFPSLRASFSSQVKKCLKPVLFVGCRFSVR